ncbi:hypothetical protein MMC19_001897 [Ptychographa xylographoides]|nr:hypothetical protein [Ptychographa xylographoides]
MRDRSFITLLHASSRALQSRSRIAIVSSNLRTIFFTPHRNLAQVQSNHGLFDDKYWFSGSGPARQAPEECGYKSDIPPPDERTVKLGKSTSMQAAKRSQRRSVTNLRALLALRILQSRLPTLLASPLPPEILSPSITLHLFPSTHPHLPTAHGRVAYHAALWTSPVAWGRLPLVGNVKLSILSERMLPSPPALSGEEKLLVRWKTCGKTKGKGMGAFYKGIGGSEQVDKITEWLGGDARDDEEFCGRFIFKFDKEGRIVEHTIECVEDGGSGEVGRVVGITDWLLGRAKNRRMVEGLALEFVGEERKRERLRARRG